VQSAVRVNYRCQLCVRSYSAWRVVRARAGDPPVPGHVCVCGGSNVGQSFIIDYRAGRPVSACGAVQCSAVAGITVCVALPAACNVALWVTAAQCYDLDNLSDGGSCCNSR